MDTPGLGPRAVTAIKIVQNAAERLARAEVLDRPLLNNSERLVLSGLAPEVARLASRGGSG
jgi:DNA repair protein RadC